MFFVSGNLLLVVLSIQLVHVEPRNFLKFIRSLKLIKAELNSGRTVGNNKNVPMNFDVITDGLKYTIDPSILVNAATNGPAQADIITGKGLILKGNAANKITFSVELPLEKKQKNICGLVITSLTDGNSGFILNLKASWRAVKIFPWNALLNPTNGESEYLLQMKPGDNTRVVIFDSVPAFYVNLVFGTGLGKNVNFKMTFITGCQYKNTIRINDCGEKIEQNSRFFILPFEVPISIQCPVNCIRHWPCWGFGTYSVDSPICWTATQYFGRYGDGFYTIYKIPVVFEFESELDPDLSHSIFCRSSRVEYAGYSFQRQHLDQARINYRNNMGA